MLDLYATLALRRAPDELPSDPAILTRPIRHQVVRSTEQSTEW